MKCPRCGSEMIEKRQKGHRRSFYKCPDCPYNLTKNEATVKTCACMPYPFLEKRKIEKRKKWVGMT